MNTNEQLLKLINENEKIKRYKELELIINKNEEVNNLINEMKEIQKQIVHAEKLNKEEMLNELQSKYKNLENSIYDFPLMSEYLDLQVEINEFIQEFKDILEHELNNDIMAK